MSYLRGSLEAMKMKTLKLYISIIISAGLLSCGSSKTVTQAQIDALDQLVQSKHFKIESDWAYPMTTNAMQQVLNSGLLGPGSSAGGINLIGNPNELTITGDSISSYLPYFGERQMQVDYGGDDTSIKFNGLMESYKVEPIKNHSYEISFKAKSKSETFDVYITVSPSLRSTIVLNSATRHPIRYSGTVGALKE